MTAEYNTQRERVTLPEYGRNVQMMVQHAMSIADRDERTRCAHAIVQVMSQLNANYKDSPDQRHKLWDHLAFMSDFKLDVDYPYGKPASEILREKPRQVPYSKNRIRFKHYGRSIELLVKKVVEMEEGEEKKASVINLANFMKRLFVNWNNENITNDELIYNDLNQMADGQLEIDRSVRLADSRELKEKPVVKAGNQGSKGRYNKNNNSQNNNYRRNR